MAVFKRQGVYWIDYYVSGHRKRDLKPLRANNRRLRYLSLEEMAQHLDVADEVLHPLLIAALHTGLRRGELFHLT
jgi:integrase